jgi:hypothetical protein
MTLPLKICHPHGAILRPLPYTGWRYTGGVSLSLCLATRACRAGRAWCYPGGARRPGLLTASGHDCRRDHKRDAAVLAASPTQVETGVAPTKIVSHSCACTLATCASIQHYHDGDCLHLTLRPLLAAQCFAIHQTSRRLAIGTSQDDLACRQQWRHSLPFDADHSSC